jgi:hypothetical protein
MNKKPQASRRSELEKELIGDIVDTQQQADTGRLHKDNQYGKANRNAWKSFAIKQGVRRRHPKRVLSQYAQIVKETSNAESAWEKALLHEQERLDVPEEYKVTDGGMVANQTGLVTTALDNFKRSKNKFSRTLISGV